MTMASGGWDVIATSQPPRSFVSGHTVRLHIEFYSDDAEPLERKDEVDVNLANVSETHGTVTGLGTVVESDAPPLVGRFVRFSVDAVSRKGRLELTATP